MSLLNNLLELILDLPLTIKRVIVLAADIFLCSVASYISFYLRIGSWPSHSPFPSFGLVFLIGFTVLVAIPLFIWQKLYREIFRYSGWPALMSIVRSIGFFALFSFLILTVIGVSGIPRTIGIIQPLILLLIIGFSRAFVSHILGNADQARYKESKKYRAVIYGAGNSGMQLASALAHDYEADVIGFIDDNSNLHGRNMAGVKIYKPELLNELIQSKGVNLILMAIPTNCRANRNKVIQLAYQAKVEVRALQPLKNKLSGSVGVGDIQPLDVDDLLGRDALSSTIKLGESNNRNKVVIVTGAGGSIGSELCRQLLDQSVKTLILIDKSEYALYMIYEELKDELNKSTHLKTCIVPILASINDEIQMRSVLEKFRPDTVYHSAAYKHVPLVEINVLEGIRNNFIGTWCLANLAVEHGVNNFILISTDKAVRPTNVMGASKRLAEMILQALAEKSNKTTFGMVRFGNVLDSSGSVVPKFREQIMAGGPITITDFRVTRFFMTIPEAVQLVFHAGEMCEGGEVFILDMGESVRIVDLAIKMVELSGLSVKNSESQEGDISLVEIGLRPGEKLYEELLIEGEPIATSHPRIFKSRESFIPLSEMVIKVKQIENAIEKNDVEVVFTILQELVTGYKRQYH